MVTRIAINGFGRIGRIVFRIAIKERGLKVVAINNPTGPEIMCNLLKYDSVHGRFDGTVKPGKGSLIVNGKKIPYYQERDPTKLPWGELKVDIVAECTGVFRTRQLCMQHINAGAKKVLLSAPSKDEVDFDVVFGVNEKSYNKKKHVIVSNESCTTNCVAPIAKVLNDAIGIDKAFLTTVHSYTNDQLILDHTHHKDPRRGRAGAINIIPTTTGAAIATTRVIPELKGKMDGISMRVPTPDGSIIDLVCQLKKPATKEKINSLFKNAASKKMKGIIEYSEDPIVSSDIIGSDYSAVYDSHATMMLGNRWVKIIAWYDNEWGYSRRMVDMMKKM
jgi:glyceraldehyde 3-phosphate dehydrogenase